MATEYEELKLTVTLADGASAGLSKMQQQFQELTSGKGATHIEKFKRESGLMRDLMKGFGAEATGAAKAFESLGFRAGAAVGGVVAVAASLVLAAKKLADFSAGVEKTGQAAKQMGISYPALRNISDQLFKQLGLNEEQSTEIVKAAVEAQVQARREGQSEMFRDMDLALAQFGPQLAHQLREMLKAAGPNQDLINTELKILEMSDKAVAERYKNDGAERIKVQQAEARRIILEQQHIDVVLQGATELAALDAQREKFLESLNTNATEYAKTWRSIMLNIKEVRDLFVGDILDPNSSPLLMLLKKAQELTEWIYDTMEEGQKKLEGKTFWEKFFYIDPKIEEFFRKNFGILGEVTPRAGVPPPVGAEAPLMSNYGSPMNDRDEAIGDNTRELKRLNDLLYTMLNPPDQAGVGGGASPATNGNLPDSTSGSPGSTPSTAPSIGPPPPAPNYGPSNPPPAGSFSTPGLFEHTPMGIVPPGGGGGGAGDAIPANAMGFLRGIARTEGGLVSGIETARSRREAYADATNRMSYGNRTSMYDYGYFQMANRDIDFAVNRLGMSPDQAQHLTGGPQHGSTVEQQMDAANEYLKRRWPEAYRRLIENNDYQGMIDATHTGKSWQWFGLRDHPNDALSEFNKTRDAARVSAAGLMGGAATTGLDAAARVRTILDANSSRRVRQLVEGAGHLRIEVPSAQGPTPGERLFTQPPSRRAMQMQPAVMGPAEPPPSWGG